MRGFRRDGSGLSLPYAPLPHVLHLTTLCDEDVAHGPTLLFDTCVFDLVNDIHAVNDFTENHMLIVQEGRGNLVNVSCVVESHGLSVPYSGDEELRSVGILSRVLQMIYV